MIWWQMFQTVMIFLHLKVGDIIYEAGDWIVDGFDRGTFMAAASRGQVMWDIVNNWTTLMINNNLLQWIYLYDRQNDNFCHKIQCYYMSTLSIHFQQNFTVYNSDNSPSNFFSFSVPWPSWQWARPSPSSSAPPSPASSWWWSTWCPP